jgi:signal transduction histidine kinase
LWGKASTHDLPFYEIMHSELKRTEVIANELLMLAKLRECKFKAVQMDSIIQEVITLLSSRAVLNNVQIHHRGAGAEVMDGTVRALQTIAQFHAAHATGRL